MKTCSIEGCERSARTRGWCDRHYDRWRRNGDPLAGRIDHGEPLRYFNEVVLAYEGDDCLIWPYSKDRDGYGHFTVEGRTRPAHREVCEKIHGPPPSPDHEAAHSCGKGRLGCVTKVHLSWKTHAENEADKLIHGTHGRGERSSSARLTESQVLQIRAMRGVPQSVLAEKFGVAQSTISFAVNGKTWSHLPPKGRR